VQFSISCVTILVILTKPRQKDKKGERAGKIKGREKRGKEKRKKTKHGRDGG
jgi:hypothetical protein